MPTNLQLDQEISATAQLVRDRAGNVSPLAIAVSRVGIGQIEPESLLSLQEVGAGKSTLLVLRRAEAQPLGPSDSSQVVWLTLDPTGRVFGIDVGGTNNSHARIHLGDPVRPDNPVTTLGNVGIGTTQPREKLEVNGNVLVTGDVKFVGGDCAEEFDVTADSVVVAPGTVMVIDRAGCLRTSDQPYDRCVAGVVSGAGDLHAGIVLGRGAGERRVPVALLGTVFCLVDAGPEPIDVGDLLTTSETAGHAMKAADPGRSFGAVLGKALAPLTTGRALIPVLVALQ